jgi:Na+/H+ antiporter
MIGFESLLGVLLIAVLLAAVARRVGAPYPAFLALGGAVLAFLPGAPKFSIDPAVALALFVAPVLLDAAYDSSPRDMRELWVPLTSLAVLSVVLTTFAVAAVVRALVPAMTWAPAITLGAIVSPPDAAAATAVLRQLRPPNRILKILEGESLLNDASALLIYRLAVGAVAMSSFSFGSLVPTLLLVVVGSLLAGPALGTVVMALTKKVTDPPTAIILQFISVFGVWIIADRLGLSPVLTMVSFAIWVARRAPARTPARLRLPAYAVWDTVVFLLNVLAFVFIGLQLRPILTSLAPDVRNRYLVIAGMVLATVILVRIVWVTLHTSVVVWKNRRFGFRPPRPQAPPTMAGGVVVSWSGMRGVITLAAALALPEGGAGEPGFPFRDLIVLTAFAVVFGTLVVQGLTLRPLIRALDLHDDDPVGRETDLARERALEAALATLDSDESPAARAVRSEFEAHLTHAAADGSGGHSSHEEVHRRALAAARRVAFDMRARDEIGDDAFHRLEEELDRIEIGIGAEG